MGKYQKNPKFSYVFLPGLGRIKDDRVIEGDYDRFYPALIPYYRVPTEEQLTELVETSTPTVEETLSRFDGVLQKLADAEAAEKSADDEVIAPLPVLPKIPEVKAEPKKPGRPPGKPKAKE